MLLSGLKYKTVLSLGYPDIVVSRETLRSITGVDVEKSSGAASKWHGVTHSLPDTEEFFAKQKATLTCVDFRVTRGSEIVADLNYPHDFGKFDLVIDPGTIEHCFNIAQAMFTAAKSVKVGGHLFNTNPLTMINHGFYNLCPTFYYDFCLANGFEKPTIIGGSVEKAWRLPDVQRFSAPMEWGMYVLSKKLEERDLTFPIQTKYR